jgi:hypothetical protein
LYIGGLLIPYYGLVDSGSDYSVISVDIAALIGFQWDETKEETGSAAGGQSFAFWEATNQVAVQTEVGGLTFTEAMVAEEDEIILGRHDFFRRYRVTINERDQLIEIQPFEPDQRH